jgi:hypothetical protein
MSDYTPVITHALTHAGYARNATGRFVIDLSPTWDDRLPDADVQTILDAHHPQDAYDMIVDTYFDTLRDDTERMLCDAIETDVQAFADRDPSHFYQILDACTEYNQDDIVFRRATYCVNLRVNTGDGADDFTANNWTDDWERAQHDRRPFRFHPHSSLRWLVHQQGYRLADVRTALRTGHSSSAFITSLITECQNTTTRINALTFFVRLSLDEILDATATRGAWTLTPDTPCGLFDPWNGAGSCLEVTLERPVILPARYVEPHIDGQRGYSIRDTYGMYSSFWKPTAHFRPPAPRTRRVS